MPSDTKRYAEHDLPALRVQRAGERARELAKAHDIPVKVALEIASEAISIVGEGTKRKGYLCSVCHGPIEFVNGRDTCPSHGALRGPWGTGRGLTLLLSFDPIDSTTRHPYSIEADGGADQNGGEGDA